MLGPQTDPQTEQPQAQTAHEEFYEPPEDSRGIDAPPPPPNVRRFNRRTVAVLVATFAVVAILAFSSAFKTPKPPATPVAQTPTGKYVHHAQVGAISTLPSNYSDVPRIGQPLPGDVGALALDAKHQGAIVPVSSTAGGQDDAGAPVTLPAQQQQLTPAQQYAQEQAIAQAKTRQDALNSGLKFTGDSSSPSENIGALMPPVVPPAQRSGFFGAGVPPVGQTQAGGDQNRQGEKNRFLNQDYDKTFTLSHGVYYPRSPYTIQAGTFIPGLMLTGIDSDLPGQIEGVVSQNVYDTVTGKYLLLPQGTKVIGIYDSRITYGQDRVLVIWTRICRPDGSCIDLKGMPGTDLSGYAGLTGPINHHLLQLMGGVLLGSVLGAGAQMSTGANTTTPSFAQLATQGAAMDINQVGQQITQKNLARQATIMVKPGTPFDIFTTKDIVIPPYRG